MEFEYHNVNLWATADLQELVKWLQDQYSFVCYWQGNQGQLWQLTGCWHDSYYNDRFWSNIVCVNTRQALRAAEAFALLASLPPRRSLDQKKAGGRHFSDQYIRTIWDSKVKQTDEYFRKSEMVPSLYRELGIDLSAYLNMDVGRIMTILDFATWIKKHNLKSPNKVLSTCIEDPEMNYIQPNTVVEFRHDGPSKGEMDGDLHLIDIASSIPAADFDLILFAQTLEHLWDPLKVLKNLFGKLRPGGYIFTSVPTLNIQHMTPYHFQHFTPMGLAMLFINAGFDIVEIGQWGNLEYEIKLLSTLKWPSWKDLSQPIINEREHPCQCWILARRLNELAETTPVV